MGEETAMGWKGNSVSSRLQVRVGRERRRCWGTSGRSFLQETQTRRPASVGGKSE